MEVPVTDFLRPIAEETLSNSFGVVKRHSFEIRRWDGSWQRQIRETYDSGDGAAVLLCDVAEKAVILIRQFRYPAFYRGENPYLVEVCAGRLDGDEPEACARKEAEEEAGYRPTRLEKAYECFMSPGSVTERLTLFLGWIDQNASVGGGGGLAHEGEDIEVVRLPFETALKMAEAGEIADAKTIMLLQFARLRGVFA